MQFAGVDGCRSGWFVVIFTTPRSLDADRLDYGDHAGLQLLCTNSTLVLVDIPIGLKEQGAAERRSDKAIRSQLGKKGSSVFPVPVRKAVYADTYEDACRKNYRLAGKKISKQTWNIVPKIRDMDSFLVRYEECRRRVRESSPELCFSALAGGPLRYGKYSRDGIEERLQLLGTVLPDIDEYYALWLARFKRSQVAKHDILDAVVLAVSGWLMYRRGAVYYPDQAEYDARGLPIQAVCFRSSTTTAG
jgi:predicted RNase H-like nuclease